MTTFQVNESLARHVEDRLRAKDSPTTIATELARAGGIGGDTVSPETIYQGVYAHGTRGLVKDLGRHLHRKLRSTTPTLFSGRNPQEGQPTGDIHTDPPASQDREYSS